MELNAGDGVIMAPAILHHPTRLDVPQLQQRSREQMTPSEHLAAAAVHYCCCRCARMFFPTF